MKRKERKSGVINRTSTEREVNDFYATDPKALEELLKVEQFNNKVWECACGQGHLSEVLKNHGYNVKSTDLIDRGYGEGNIDFLNTNTPFDGDVISNPPYKFAQEFVEQALKIVSKGNRVAMLLKLTFLESKARAEFFAKYPPEYIYVSSSRIQCAKEGNFEKYKNTGSETAYAWFIWRKDSPAIEPKVRWFN